MADEIMKDGITRRNFVKGAAAGIGAGALVGLGAKKARAQGKVIKWRMQSIFPSIGLSGQFSVLWAKSLTELSGGRLIVEFSEPGTIVPAMETFQSVSNGTLDAGGAAGMFSRGILPEGEIENGLPFAWDTVFDCHDAYANRGLLEEIRKVYAEHNIFYATPAYSNNFYGYATVKPVRKPADFKGMKMRDLGGSADLLALYGAIPTIIPPGEFYMALKMKTIEGVHYGVAGLEDLKIGEVCKYYILEPQPGPPVINILVNMKSYNALPEDLKKLVRDYSTAFSLPVAMRDESRQVFEISKKYGVEFIRWSQEDIQKTRKLAIEKIWPKIAAKSARCKKLVEIVINQARLYGKI